MRNMMATLLLSQGVPMITAGDELARSQRGNNNAYCQDNQISWIDWRSLDERPESFLSFVRRLITLRREHVVFRRNRFFQGTTIPGTNEKDIVWLRPDGTEKEAADWNVPYACCLSFLINGAAGEYHLTAFGEPEPDDTFLAILNAYNEPVTYKLPANGNGTLWEGVINTGSETGEGGDFALPGGAEFVIGGRALALLVLRPHR
jgi:glycogen operon protein